MTKINDSLMSKTKISKLNDDKLNSKKPKTKIKIEDNKSDHKKPKTNQKRGFGLKNLFSKLTK